MSVSEKTYEEIVGALINAGFEIKRSGPIGNESSVLRIGHSPSQTFSYIKRDRLPSFYIGMTMMNSVMKKQTIFEVIEDGMITIENIGPITEKGHDEFQPGSEKIG